MFYAAPCLNCETEPAEMSGLFCDPECRDEYNGEGAYDEYQREGETEAEFFARTERESDRAAWASLDA